MALHHVGTLKVSSLSIAPGQQRSLSGQISSICMSFEPYQLEAITWTIFFLSISASSSLHSSHSLHISSAASVPHRYVKAKPPRLMDVKPEYTDSLLMKYSFCRHRIPTPYFSTLHRHYPFHLSSVALIGVPDQFLFCPSK